MKYPFTKTLVAPCFICAVAITGAHAEGHWASKAPMPIALAYSASGALHGKLYVTAGNNSSHNLSTATQIWDPVANSWSAGVPIPTPVSSPRGAVIGDNFYVVGGCLGSDCRIGTTGLTQAFNFVTQSWTTKASMPTARYAFGLSVAGGHLYAVGGTGPCPPCTPLNVLEEYNPATDSWTTLAPMPTARRDLAAGFANGQLFAIGGDDAAGTTVFKTVEAYSPSTNTWATKASLPTAQADQGVGFVDGHLFSISGTSAPGVNTNIVQAYDPLDNGWFAAATIPIGRFFADPVTIGGSLYVAGNSEGNVGTSSLEKFTP